MARPTMILQLEPHVASSATGYLTLYASTEGQAVGHATAADQAIAGERKDTARPTRSVADGVTVNGDATLTSATAAFTLKDVGRGISGTGIPAGTSILSYTSATSVEMTANATASGTALTLTIGTAGLLSFPLLNPNSGSSDDVIDDPTGTVWRLVVKPNASSVTMAPIFFTAPDTAGVFTITANLSSEPGALPAPGTVALIESTVPGAVDDALATAGIGIAALDEAPDTVPVDAQFVLQRSASTAERIDATRLIAELLAGHNSQTLETDETYDPANYRGAKNVSTSAVTLTLPALSGDDPRHVMLVQQLNTGTVTVTAGASALVDSTMTATAGKGQILLCVAAGKVFGVTVWVTTLLGSAAGSYQPLDSDLTAIAALTTTAYGRAFLALADAAAGRTALGLGTAAVEASGAFDAAGSAAAAQAASQPLDSDLTAIAALTTTAFGRSLLALSALTYATITSGASTMPGGGVINFANNPLFATLPAISLRTSTEPNPGLYVTSTGLYFTDQTTGAVQASIAASAANVLSITTAKLQSSATPTVADDLTRKGYVDGAFQPLDSDLTSIAALSTTAYGRAFLALANQAALMALLSAASDTAQGIVELATAAEVSTASDTARAVTPAGAGSVYQRLDAVGRLIGLTAYSPTVTATYTSATSATLADVDATNLAVTFTPLTSAVYIEVLIRSQVSGGASVNCSIGLREGGSDVKSTTDQYTASYQWRSVGFHVDGLTPGVAKTYKLAYGGSGAQTISITAGDSVGAPSIKVWAAA